MESTESHEVGSLGWWAAVWSVAEMTSLADAHKARTGPRHRHEAGLASSYLVVVRETGTAGLLQATMLI